jgi:protein-tyrosine phosphatase
MAALPAPANVLVLCLGNINRSVYAAEVLRRQLSASAGPPIRIHSAGFIGPGRPASELARSTAHARGFDLASHVSRVAESADLRAADLVVVMTPEQSRRARSVAGKRLRVLILGDLDPEPIGTRAIQDPYGQSEEVFEQVFDRIDRCVATLAAAVLDLRRVLP